jgi:hypothetical protein
LRNGSQMDSVKSVSVGDTSDRLSEPLDTPEVAAFGAPPAYTTSTGVDTG